MSNKNTQIKRIIQYCNENGSISQLEATYHLGIMRLASRICDMKMQGIKVSDQMESRINRYGDTVRYKRYFVVTNND